MNQAHHVAYGIAGSTSIPPASTTPAAMLEAEREAALCASFEDQAAEAAEAECLSGCDYSEGALSAQGCHW